MGRGADEVVNIITMIWHICLETYCLEVRITLVELAVELDLVDFGRVIRHFWFGLPFDGAIFPIRQSAIVFDRLIQKELTRIAPTICKQDPYTYTVTSH